MWNCSFKILDKNTKHLRANKIRSAAVLLMFPVQASAVLVRFGRMVSWDETWATSESPFSRVWTRVLRKSLYECTCVCWPAALDSTLFSCYSAGPRGWSPGPDSAVGHCWTGKLYRISCQLWSCGTGVVFRLWGRQCLTGKKRNALVQHQPFAGMTVTDKWVTDALNSETCVWNVAWPQSQHDALPLLLS